MSEEFIYLSDVAEGMSEAHLTCRDLGHSWREASFEPSPNNGLYVRALVCRSCATQRTDRVTRWGTVYGRNYQYANGYQLKGWGDFVRDRSTFRRAIMKRAGLEVEEPT